MADMNNRSDDAGRFGRTAQQSGSAGSAGSMRGDTATANATDTDYWRSNYQTRPYVEPGVSYDEYAPAYQYGTEEYTRAPGRRFEEVESDLSQRWDRARGSSKLTWERAKAATRDAWDRMAGSHASSDKFVGTLKNLLQISMDGAKGFELAAEKVRTDHASLFRKLGQERNEVATELRSEIERRQGKPIPKEGDVAGALHRGWISIKSALTSGEKAVINEAERGEDHAVAAFQDALNKNSLPGDLEVLITRLYTRVKASHDKVSAIKHSME